MTLVYSNPHLAIRSLRKLTSKSNLPLCDEPFIIMRRYGQNLMEFTFRNDGGVGEVGKRVKSRRGHKVIILRPDIIEEWDDLQFKNL